MAKVTKEKISIFLASSAELREDREKFADFVMKLQVHYSNRGFGLQLEKWEYLDPAYNGRPKQEEYNDVIKQCNVFVALFHNKAGEYTLQEFDLAVQECQTRQLPLFIYFREQTFFDKLKNGTEGLKPITDRIAKLQHFWGRYGTNDKLHLDFVLLLDSYIFDGKSELNVENGHVMLEDVKVADMSGLPFAMNNNEYQQLDERLKSLNEDIEQIRQDIEDDPDNEKFPERLSKKVLERDRIQEKLKVQQESLLGAAKRIAELEKQNISEKLQEAINAFNGGQLERANTLLDQIANDAESHLERLDQNRAIVHQDIEALRLQTQTIMAEAQKPIEERIDRVAEIYAKADDWANRSAYDKKKYAKLLFDYGEFLYKYAHYDEAENVYLRQIALSEEIYGKDSTDTATSYNNIGVVYIKKGNYDKALEYYFKALSIREIVLGKEHPETANSYNNIGGVYNSKGDYDMALEYFFKALDIDEKVSGVEHTNTAIYNNNIGMVYDEKSDYEKALEYYFKALEIFKRVLGTEHPSTATSYNNIGEVYMNQRKYDKALEYHLKALAIRENVFGTEHPETAQSYNNIGFGYRYQGDYDKALEYVEKALKISEKVLGNKHPFTQTVQGNINSLKLIKILNE